jgi:hypothetical protein
VIAVADERSESCAVLSAHNANANTTSSTVHDRTIASVTRRGTRGFKLSGIVT